jgi:hypothetical protein
VVGVTGFSPLFSRLAVEQRGSTLSIRDAGFGDNEVYAWVAVAAVFAGLLLLGPPWAYLICPLVPIFGIGALLQLGHARSTMNWRTGSDEIAVRRRSSLRKCTVTVPAGELSVAPPRFGRGSDAYLFREGHRALRLASGRSNSAVYAALAVAGMLAEAQGGDSEEDLPFEWEPFTDYNDSRLARPLLMHVESPTPDTIVVGPTFAGRLLQVLPLVSGFIFLAALLLARGSVGPGASFARAMPFVAVAAVAGCALFAASLFEVHMLALDRAGNRLRARLPKFCGRAVIDISLSSVAAVRLAPRASPGYDLDLLLIRPRGLPVHVLALPEAEPLENLGREIAGFLGVPLLVETEFDPDA